MTQKDTAPVGSGSSSLVSTGNGTGALPSGIYDPSSAKTPSGTPRSGGDDGGGTGWPGSGGWSYGGGGGSGTSLEPTDAQKEAADSLAPIVKYGNDKIILNQGANSMDALKTADEGAKALSSYQDKMAMSKAGAEWFSNLLKEQSAYQALRAYMGNAALGSGWAALNSLMQRGHDATASTILETLEGNLLDNASNLYQTLQSNANAWNENAADIETKLREGFSDYASQMVNINPRLATGEEEGYDQIIDKENKDLKVPDWLTTDYYDENKRGVVDMPWIMHIRPDKATQTSWNKGLNPGSTNNSGAANSRYWEAMTANYGQRRK